MNENRDDKFQEEYDVDVMADDTEDIDLFEEDDDIGDLSDFEGEEEQSKSKFLFGKNKNANSEKKPFDKKNLIILLGGVGIVLILGLLAVPGMINWKGNDQRRFSRVGCRLLAEFRLLEGSEVIFDEKNTFARKKNPAYDYYEIGRASCRERV